jgi:hypothetical protein
VRSLKDSSIYTILGISVYVIPFQTFASALKRYPRYGFLCGVWVSEIICHDTFQEACCARGIIAREGIERDESGTLGPVPLNYSEGVRIYETTML